MTTNTIYLDHAATSAPKPEVISTALQSYLSESGLSAGRGAYRRSIDIGRIVQQARSKVAKILNLSNASRIVFTSGGTESLNLVIHGVLRKGDHVITTVMEHNSVLRPLAKLVQQGTIEVTYLQPDDEGFISVDQLQESLRPQTRLFCCIHASNVNGLIQPIESLVSAAHGAGLLTLVDAAQTIGTLPIDLNLIPIDFLAAPAHKGLQGLLGTGFVAIKSGLEEVLQPIVQGGTGSQSDSEVQPTELPYRYESGSLNVPGLVALNAVLNQVTIESIKQERLRQLELMNHIEEGVKSISSLQCYQSGELSQRMPVFSMNWTGLDSQTAGSILDEHYHIETRSGFHCAARMHRYLGTESLGGTVRISLGHSSTKSEIDLFLSAAREIAITS